MRNTAIFFALIPVVWLAAACDVNSSSANNSSQGDNDYFEEPISERSEKYSPALETSNAFIEHFSHGQLVEARGLLDPRLQAIISEEQFLALHEQMLNEYGPLLEYKPMQWGFATHTKRPNVLASVKIAIHQNAEMFYVITFEDDGIYDRIIGFKVRAKGEGERVPQAAFRELRGT